MKPLTHFHYSQLGLQFFKKGRYFITDEGYVFDKEKRLNPKPNVQGYQAVSLLCEDGKRRATYIHHLMAHIHHGVPENRFELQIDHIDQNRLNNAMLMKLLAKYTKF